MTVTTGAGGATVGGTVGGVGGTITLTAGAGGAGTSTTGGAGGAVAITAGAGGNGTTSGAAGSITLTAGAAGTGGNVAGGNINLVPGASVGTGIPGEVQVNSSAGWFEVVWSSGISTAAIPASGSVVTMFMANRAYRVKYVSVIEATFGTSETYTFYKDTGTTVPGAGTAILTGAVTMAVSNTRVTGTLSGTLATIALAAGDRLSFTIGGTVGSAKGATVAIGLVPI